jgi:hypothetical protein
MEFARNVSSNDKQFFSLMWKAILYNKGSFFSYRFPITGTASSKPLRSGLLQPIKEGTNTWKTDWSILLVKVLGEAVTVARRLACYDFQP